MTKWFWGAHSGALCAEGDSAHASGVPGSLDHLVWQYCVLEFFIGALGCFPVSNNAALFAEVGSAAVS